MRIIASICSCIILLSFVGCGGSNSVSNTNIAGSPTATVTGFVATDAAGKLQVSPTSPDAANGHTVASAVVLAGGAPQAWATTDARGYFSLQNVPFGPQTFYISAAGCARVAFTATVNTDTVNALSPLPANIVPAPPARWTVLVYMAANNDLTDGAVDDINKMEKVGSTPDVNVLAEITRSKGNYEKQYGDFTGTRRLAVMKDISSSPDAIHSAELQNLGQIDSGNPTTLHDFITWGQSYAPAEHYLLFEAIA